MHLIIKYRHNYEDLSALFSSFIQKSALDTTEGGMTREQEATSPTVMMVVIVSCGSTLSSNSDYAIQNT